MATAKQFRAVEIDDAKIAELTADAGASPTYAASIDIPSIIEFAPTTVFKSARFEGDARIKGVHSRPSHIEWSLTCEAVPLDVLAIFTGSTVTSAGTTPNQTNTYTLAATDLGKYFKLSGRWLGVQGADDASGKGLKTVLYKCKCEGNISYTLNGDKASVKAQGVAIPTDATGNKIKDIEGQETQGVLS